MLTVLLACVFAGTEKPSALQAMETAHHSIKNADIRWSITMLLGPDAGNPRYYRNAYAGSDRLSTDLGDSEGVVARTTDGEPHTICPRSVLLQRDASWVHQDCTMEADKYENGDPTVELHDVRTMGMLPTPIFFTEVDNYARQARYLQEPNPAYSQQYENGLYKVASRTDAATVVWYIDPQQGWHCVQSELYDSKGTLASYSKTEYQEHNGVWVPVTTGYFDPGGAVRTVLEVESAVVNDPNAPGHLSPADIGVESGMIVTVHRDPPAVSNDMMWDGQNTVSYEDFGARYKAGTVQNGPAVLAYMEMRKKGIIAPQLSRKLQPSVQPYPGGRVPTSAVAAASSQPSSQLALQTFEDAFESSDPWDVYTEKFIKNHKLDSEQVSKARSILNDCKALRQRCLGLLKPSGTKRDVYNDRIVQRIDSIFESGLKPRLDKVPTRKQRAEYEATTRPASAPAT